jgi:hypothetical protein
MTTRRERWLRRFAIGLSLAAFASPAAAKPDEGGAGGNGAAIASPAAAVRPDDRADRFTGVQQTLFASNAVRPDDRANRFAISDRVSTATSHSTDASVSWDSAVKLGFGALALVLALGFGVGYVRRPKLAGL